jgi:hypothetical protein
VTEALPVPCISSATPGVHGKLFELLAFFLSTTGVRRLDSPSPHGKISKILQGVSIWEENIEKF